MIFQEKTNTTEPQMQQEVVKSLFQHHFVALLILNVAATLL